MSIIRIIGYLLWTSTLLSAAVAEQSKSNAPSGLINTPISIILLPHGSIDLSGGTNFNMFCQVDSTQPTLIRWYKDGQEVVPSEGVFLLHDRLSVHYVTGQDAGIYNCTAETPSELVSSMTLKVTVVGLHFLRRLPAEVVSIVGYPVTLFCQATLRPTRSLTLRRAPPEVLVSWFKSGSLLMVSSESRVSNSVEGLHFAYVNQSDAGSYKCLASHSGILVAVTTTLRILDPIDKVRMVITLNQTSSPHVVLSWIPVKSVDVTSYSLVVNNVLKAGVEKLVKAMTVMVNETSLTLPCFLPGNHYEVSMWANVNSLKGPTTTIHFISPGWYRSRQTLSISEETFMTLDVENPFFWLSLFTCGVVMCGLLISIQRLHNWNMRPPVPSAVDEAAVGVGKRACPAVSTMQEWGFVNPAFQDDQVSQEDADKVSLNNLELVWTDKY